MPGGRKVVLVGRDGATFWDDTDSEEVTPLVIHSMLDPVALGSVTEFVRAQRLTSAAKRVVGSLEARRDDSLFLMRLLHALGAARPQGQGDDWIPDESALRAARERVEAQSRAIRDVHRALADVAAAR